MNIYNIFLVILNILAAIFNVCGVILSILGGYGDFESQLIGFPKRNEYVKIDMKDTKSNEI